MKLITLEYLEKRGACCLDDPELMKKIKRKLPATPIDVCRGKIVPGEDKLWLLLHEDFIPKNDLFLLACDFAEHVLHIFEDKYPEDMRPRNAIEARRGWVAGIVSDEELNEATWAAWDASAKCDSWDASVARAARAASAASVARAMNYAADEQKWQFMKLKEYFKNGVKL